MTMPPMPQIRGVHHSAYRCRDAEETRHFYEDILGLTARAALTFDKQPGTETPMRFMHLFFEMGDGNYIAFFDLPDEADGEDYHLRDGMKEYHFAMEVADRTELQAVMDRLNAHKVPVFGPIDHEFVHSVYFWDPNGLSLEVTIRDACHDRVMTEEGEKARETIARWMADTADARKGQAA